MKTQQDAVWRGVAGALELDGFDHRGKAVARERATRDDTLRGTVDGHAVSLSYGLGGHADGVTVIEVRASRSLLLGLEIRSVAASHDYRGRQRYAGSTTIEAIDRAHTDALLARAPDGPEIVRIVERFGTLGWALLGDEHLRVHVEAVLDTTDAWTKLTREAVRAMALAESACAASGPSPWSVRVLEGMLAAAAPVGLEVDREGLIARGKHRDCALAMRVMQTKERWYDLVCTAALPKHAKKGTRVVRRDGLGERVLALFGVGATGRGAAFDRAFRVEGPGEWVGPEVAAALVGAEPHVAVEIASGRLTLRAPAGECDAARMLKVAIAVIDGVTGPQAPPYR